MNDVTEAPARLPRVVVRPRDAASLILLRGQGKELEVLAGRRPLNVRFMPGVHVFPGGAIDPPDRIAFSLETGTDTLGPQLARCARAALRETWEEAGVLVGRPAHDPIKSKRSIATRAEAGVQSHRSPLALGSRFRGSGDFTPSGKAPPAAHQPHAPTRPIERAYRERGLVAAMDLLTYVGRAITPSHSHRRFNTRFFLAEGSNVIGEPGASEELEEVRWYPIGRQLLASFADVTRFMLARAIAVRNGTATGAAPLFYWAKNARRIGICREARRSP